MKLIKNKCKCCENCKCECDCCQGKHKRLKMEKLIEEIIKPILEANPKIKKVVGIYGGRFQPFGPHHYKTYKWLERQVDFAYITTSNIKKPPRHPMNFREKVRHMTKMGVKANRIVEEKHLMLLIML